jgi:hypothetical protein
MSTGYHFYLIMTGKQRKGVSYSGLLMHLFDYLQFHLIVKYTITSYHKPKENWSANTGDKKLKPIITRENPNYIMRFFHIKSTKNAVLPIIFSSSLVIGIRLKNPKRS